MGIIVQDDNTLSRNPGDQETRLSIDATSGKVSTIIGSPEIVHNAFYKQNIVVSDTHGVCIQVHFDEGGFDFHSFQMQLRICIDTIYKDGVYFEGLDVKKLEYVLYGTEEQVRSEFDSTYGGIRICSAVKKMSEPDWKGLSVIYAGKLDPKDRMELAYTSGSLLQIERMLGENYASHDLFMMRRDFFHAYLWSYGFRFHGTSSFLDCIDGKKRNELDSIVQSSKGIIANGKKATETQDDTISNYETFEIHKSKNSTVQIGNPFPPLKIRRRPAMIDGKPASGGEMECFFPMAKSGQAIMEIIAGKIGNSGINIQGEILSYKEIKNIDVGSIVHPDSMELIQIDTDTDPLKTRIIAKENIYLSFDKQGKLVVSRHKKYIGTISSKTGSLSLIDDKSTFILQGDIESGYHIRCYDIVYSGELHGKIFAKNQATVRSGGIIGGTIISEHGNITIEKGTRVQDGTRLIATNGTITIYGDLNHATIIGHTIKIHGTATKCTLIGGNVEIGVNNGSNVFAESVLVDSDKDGNAEYTLLVYAGIQSLISASTKKLHDAEGKGELEKFRIAGLGKKIDGNEVLTRGTIHTDSRIEIMPIPFLIDTTLGELLETNNQEKLLQSKREYGLQNLISAIQRTDGILCPGGSFPLTRSSAISILESSLVNRSVIREIPRDPLFVRGVRLMASVGQLSGHIFDYSDSGASFILKNPSVAGSITKDATIDVTILDNQAISFFVTRVENKSIKGENYTFIAGVYITQGIGMEISKAVARIDTHGKGSK